MVASVARQAKPDGRKKRWEQHKELRRAELVDGTLRAINDLGGDAGMDEIAATIGVSKTVLYRYFNDKSDLTTATMARFAEATLIPRMNAAVTAADSNVTAVRAAVAEYVNISLESAAVYDFVASASNTAKFGRAEKLVGHAFAEQLLSRISPRNDYVNADAAAYTLIGAVRMTTEWWMSERTITQDELVDHLATMVWHMLRKTFPVTAKDSSATDATV